MEGYFFLVVLGLFFEGIVVELLDFGVEAFLGEIGVVDGEEGVGGFAGVP